MQPSPVIISTYPMMMGGANDSMNPRYRCFCQKCHVTFGAKVIGIIEVIGMAITYKIYMGYFVHPSEITFLTRQLGLLSFLLMAAVPVGLMFIGIKKEKKGFVLPHLVFQIFCIVGFVICSAFFLYFTLIGIGITATVETKSAAQSAIYVTAVMLGLFSFGAFSATLEIWWFIVIYRLYEFLKEKQLNNSSAPT